MFAAMRKTHAMNVCSSRNSGYCLATRMKVSWATSSARMHPYDSESERADPLITGIEQGIESRFITAAGFSNQLGVGWRLVFCCGHACILQKGRQPGQRSLAFFQS